MEEKSLVVVEQPQNVQTESVLFIEQFINDNYRLRRNVLSGKVEFKMRDDVTADYRPLTQEAQNSMVIHALREGLDEVCNPKADITMYVNSEEVRMYNPVLAFLNDLPKWDGQNHVAKLFSRLPGLSSEQLAFLAVWLRATVAHWLQLDTLHGNEVVPVLIGAQGCGKTTFLRRLLPCQLRLSASRVLSGSPEPVEQVRQGDGADEQPAGEPRRARSHPPQSARGVETDLVEE